MLHAGVIKKRLLTGIVKFKGGKQKYIVNNVINYLFHRTINILFHSVRREVLVGQAFFSSFNTSSSSSESELYSSPSVSLVEFLLLMYSDSTSLTIGLPSESSFPSPPTRIPYFLPLETNLSCEAFFEASSKLVIYFSQSWNC